MAGFESLDKPSDRYKWLGGGLSRLPYGSSSENL